MMREATVQRALMQTAPADGKLWQDQPCRGASMQECCKAWGCTRARGAQAMWTGHWTVPGTHRGTCCLLLWLRFIGLIGLIGEGVTPAQQGLVTANS